MTKKKTKKSNSKIGILGGSFNPPHAGHLNLALSVKNQLGLEKVLFIPCNRSPLREEADVTGRDRLEMTELAIKAFQSELEVSAMEIDRGGTSYTVDTLKQLNETYSPEELYLILGMDAFHQFHLWHKMPEILKLANIAVATRPECEDRMDWKQWPEDLQKQVKSSRGKKVTLKTGTTITFVEIDPYNVSSSEVRKRLRSSHVVDKMISPSVLAFIKEKGLYQRTFPLVKDYRAFALFCSEKARDKKALGLKTYDLTALNRFTDYALVCSGTSGRHTSAVAEGIIESAREEFGLKPLSVEGLREGRWVLIDFGPVVIHVFDDMNRSYYRIEELWKKCPQLEQNENPPTINKLKTTTLA